MKLFDSHCHLNDEKFNENRDETIKAIFNSGVSRLINAGYSLESSKSALQIANKYTQIYAVCGISPNDIKDNIDETLYEIEEIKNIIKNQNKVIGIGEIGLDYHWNIDNKELQKLAFTKQIELANQLEFPIVIHTREAVMDTIQILKQHEVYKKGVFHCCPLNPELVKEALKLGFYISFAGPVTFKNSKNADDVVKWFQLIEY